MYGSILQNTRNKRKSSSRTKNGSSANHYKEKYARIKHLYESERNSSQKEIDKLTNENNSLKQIIEDIKSDHFSEIMRLKETLEDYTAKIEYYEETLKNERLRSDSAIDDISRSNTESKTGESTIESDKLTNILKSKEDHIRKLMQELRDSNNYQDTPKSDTNSGSNLLNLELENKRLTSEVNKLKKELETADKRYEILAKCNTHREVSKNNEIKINFKKNKEQTPEF